ncbi:MAG: transglutaminase family protein [Clostridia bacterium]
MKSVRVWNIVVICVFFVFFMDIGQVSAANWSDGIAKNGVEVNNLISKKVQGKISLSGYTDQEKIKILVAKGKSQVWYDVMLKDGNFNEEIWLAQGKGMYTISIMVNEYDRKYSYGPKFTIMNLKEVNPFLVPAKHIESHADEIKQLAEDIINGKKTDKEKARAIYDWVIGNIRYDYEKYALHKDKQYDNQYGALYTLKAKKGVCYDYAALTAALSRAAGLQAKVVKGEGKLGSYTGFHAWNEIYSSEEERWVSIDTTFGVNNEKSFFDNADFDESHVKTEEC